MRERGAARRRTTQAVVGAFVSLLVPSSPAGAAFLHGVANSLLQAAGATVVTLLIIAPGLVAAAVIVFLAAWGASPVPLVYAGTGGAQPLTVAIPTFANQFVSNYGLHSAAGLLGALPPPVLVLVLRRHLLAGLTAGAAT